MTRLWNSFLIFVIEYHIIFVYLISFLFLYIFLKRSTVMSLWKYSGLGVIFLLFLFIWGFWSFVELPSLMFFSYLFGAIHMFRGWCSYSLLLCRFSTEKIYRRS